MKIGAMDRRNFLKTLGLAGPAIALPWWSLARSQEPQSNRRVLFLYAEAGWVYKNMIMRPPWLPANYSAYNPRHPDTFLEPDTLEWEFDFTDSRLEEQHMSRVLRPLFRHRDQMTFLEGLAMLTSAFDSNGDGHAQGHIACMSAVPSAYAYDGIRSQGSGPSIDQRIHDFLRASNPNLVSLEFVPAPERRAIERFHAFLYRDNGMGGADRMPVESDPVQAFARFFGSFGGGEPSPLDLGQDFVLETVAAQYRDLAPRMRSDDRAKLESHLAMVRDLQRRLATRVSCDAPTPPTGGEGLSKEELYDNDVDAFATMIATAFACGVSRVASLGLALIPPQLYGVPDSASIHHDYEHNTDPFLEFMEYGGNPPELWLNSTEAMTRRLEYQSEAVARVIDILRSVPEDGGTLLDNTLVVYVSELAHGSHGHEHYPIILFGGFGGAVRPGRYIKYRQDNPNPWNRNYFNEYTGTSHSKLFVSICQGMGMDIDFLGRASIPGSVPHRNIEGTVDLSGPLPRLA